ncbi:MAG: hypothetical protein ACK53N_17070, partial [Alphaproteobacteria bacterium]
GVFPLVIQHHPNRSGSDLRGEFVRRFAHNGSILFGSWSLRQTRGGSMRQKFSVTQTASLVTKC